MIRREGEVGDGGELDQKRLLALEMGRHGERCDLDKEE